MMSFFSALPGYLSPRNKPLPLREQFAESVFAQTKPLKSDNDGPMSPRLYRTPRGGLVEIRFAFKQKNLNLVFEFKQKDHIIISRMVSQTPGKGHGNEAMEFVKRLADEKRVSLAMFAEPIAHKSMPMENVRRWLEGHGFHLLTYPHTLYIRDPDGIGPDPAPAP